ncbi:carbohydrate ABC transporter permease [Cohnella hongkongensis]|uniref:Carbohydrate ABC transporter permease n=1 Tax=Cohnella hongkongensis TaxID=178337 RepID=A0ABV9FGH7_9BACL
MRTGRDPWNFVYFLFLAAMLVFCVLPIYWIYSISVKYPVDALSMPPKLIFTPTLDNFRTILESDFFGPFMNSLKTSLLATFGTLLLGAPAAYAFSRWEGRPLKNTQLWVLSPQMIPPIVVMVPFFLFWTTLDLTSTHVPLVVMLILANLPLCVWIVKGFFDDIPNDFDESGMLDGLNRVTVFFRIALPLNLTGLVAAGGFIFIQCWNEFTFSFLLTEEGNKTLPVQIAQFITPTGTLWGQITAASVLAMLPQILLLIFLQKYLVRGFSMGLK